MNASKFILIFLSAGAVLVSCARNGRSSSQIVESPADTLGAGDYGRIEIPQLKKEYPRMIDEKAAVEYIEQLMAAALEAEGDEAGAVQVISDENRALMLLRNKIEPYVARHGNDPEWIVSRLQLFWESHSTDIYINGEDFDHSAGHAPAPTVRYSASRGGQSSYRRPPLEEVKPYQDSLLWMINRQTERGEWIDQRKAGGNIESINREIMGLARNAAFLYALYGDERCAKFAADIFDAYMTGLYYRNVPIDLNHGQQQTLVGLTSWEVIHEDIAVTAAQCYDCLHDYLARTHRDKIRIYEDTFRKWAQNIIDNGVPHNNWDLIQARFALTIAIVLNDDSAYSDGRGRQFFLNQILNESSVRQWSVGRLIDFGFDSETGIWYESPGYSNMVIGEFMALVKLVRNCLGIDLTENYPILRRAVDVLPQYLLPNGMRVSWGDGFYEAPDTTDVWPAGPVEDYVSPTFWSEKVSWFAARTGMDRDNSLMMSVSGSKGNHMHANGISLELYGKGYIQGVDLGRGTGYTTLDYAEFYSQFPAHNTVCVDGVSSYPVMMSQHGYSLNGCYPSPYNNQSAANNRSVTYPVEGEEVGSVNSEVGEGVVNSENINIGENSEVGESKVENSVENSDEKDEALGKWESFGGVMYGDFSFVEPETQSDQRRQTLIVATDPEGGYYVDVFRSRRRDGQDKFHDYFYHNIGQDFTLDCDLEPTEDLAFAGGHIYAYSYLWDKYESKTDNDVSGKFTMTLEDGSENGMRLWMRGERNRTIFKALSPCIYSLTRTPMPYDISGSPTQTFIARQWGEAWTRPFAAVYEPYDSKDVAEREADANAPSAVGTIAKIEWPECNVTSGVALKVTKTDGRQDIIFSADSAQAFSIDLTTGKSSDESSAENESGNDVEARNGSVNSNDIKKVSGNAVIAVVSEGEYFMAQGTELKAGDVKITAKQPATVALFSRDGRWYYSSDTPVRIRIGGRIITW
ncbi:MAG: heparinase II/III-family protein [Bacteroidales bacterium]|nr:heparinase II/III-family protein [Bacteroidales bacterium]